MTIVAMACKLVLGVVLVTACAPAPAVPSATPSPSALAAVEASRDLDGKPVGHAAVPTLVVVFASWCPHCRVEFRELAALRSAHPDLRIVGIDYQPQEEYDHRGGPAQLRAFVADVVPWLEVVAADDALFAALGSPPHIPTTLVFDATGAPTARLGGEASRARLARALGY